MQVRFCTSHEVTEGPLDINLWFGFLNSGAYFNGDQIREKLQEFAAVTMEGLPVSKKDHKIMHPGDDDHAVYLFVVQKRSLGTPISGFVCVVCVKNSSFFFSLRIMLE